jgi:hypothetical protein
LIVVTIGSTTSRADDCSGAGTAMLSKALGRRLLLRGCTAGT